LRNLAIFSLGKILSRLNRIRFRIHQKHFRPFPKPEIFWLSHYTYCHRYIRIEEGGRIAGGLSRFVSSLVDFSFVRCLVADRYGVAGVAYDPVSLFLLQLFCYLEKFPDMKTFLATVRDHERGKHYRLYAGIRDPHIPCEATFTNLKDRLGQERYRQIFHVLVEMVDLLGFLTHRILAIDGTLFPTYARYKGCTYFSPACRQIEFKGLIQSVRKRILRRLSEPERIVPGKEIKIKGECPSPNFPEDIKRPKVELLVLTLQQANPERPSPLNQLFALRDELAELNLDLVAKRGLLHAINLADEVDSFCFSCPKLPRDMEARIGVRRNPQNPDRKEKIFGFNAVIGTAVELTLGIELPVACITIAGNAQEGNQYIPIKEQIFKYHGKHSKIDVADAKYDELHNYEYSRTHGAIPVIDYNPRNEKITAPALKQRGYDRNGWPYAPCGILTRPNGFDLMAKRASFTCRRQCLYSADERIQAYTSLCPHWINYHGYCTHMSLNQFPRLINEIVRGTPRYQGLKALRPASERINSSAKNGLNILTKPKIRGLKNAGILALLAVMVILLKRIALFIVKVTLQIRKTCQKNTLLPHHVHLPGPMVSKYIWNLIRRE
jgi:hypothetical protein